MYSYPAGLSSREDVADYERATDDYYAERDYIRRNERADRREDTTPSGTVTEIDDPWATDPYPSEGYPF